MSITRKTAFARAEHIDADGAAWIAEARDNTGVWVIHDREYPEVHGMMTAFGDDTSPTLLMRLTPEQRKNLGMSDDTYHELNVLLSIDDRTRQKDRK